MRSSAALAAVLVCGSACNHSQADVVNGIATGPSARRFIEVAQSAMVERELSGISFAYDTTGGMYDPETEAIRRAARIRLLLNKIYLTGFWDPASHDSTSMRCVDRFTSLAGRQPTHIEALFHDAILRLTTAVREGGLESAAIRDYLLAWGENREPCMGVTGPISFGDERESRLHMIRASGLPG